MKEETDSRKPRGKSDQDLVTGLGRWGKEGAEENSQVSASLDD